jgi:hypothetical protein
VADERIRALEAEVAEARRCLDGGTDCMDDKRKLRAALRQIAGQEQQERADRTRLLKLEEALREAYQITHYGHGSMQDVDDMLERAIRGG